MEISTIKLRKDSLYIVVILGAFAINSNAESHGNSSGAAACEGLKPSDTILNYNSSRKKCRRYIYTLHYWH